MKLRRRKALDAGLPGLVGTVRLDRRTKDLTTRLRPGDVAVIDHLDLDRASADALVQARVGAVVNASASTSGRYPNLGPEILVAAGIPLLDGVGPSVFGDLREGDQVRLHGATLHSGDRVVASGTAQTLSTVESALVQARTGLASQLEDFAANAMNHLGREHDLLVDGAGMPVVATAFAGRQVVVVVRAHEYRRDLAALRRYLREYRPLLVGVEGGAEALREAGLTPDVILGDLEDVSDRTLRCGAEIVVCRRADGRTPGLQRAQDLGLDAVVFPAAGSSEDAALLLADENGASLIVAVGSHATLYEFLDRGRAGMASAFLTRLRVGGTLVDARAVTALYRRRISTWSLLLLVLAAVIAVVAAVLLSVAGQSYLTLLLDEGANLLDEGTGLLDEGTGLLDRVTGLF